jgi:hypothetical protein
MSSAHDPRLIRSVAVGFAALVACKGPATAPEHAAPSGSAATSGSASPPDAAVPILHHAPAVVVMDEPAMDLPHRESFRLLDAGHGERSALRYALAAGAAAFTARTALSTRHLDGGQFSPPVALPAIRDGFAITIAADHPERLALRALAGEAAANTADADAYLAAWRANLQDRHFTVSFDDRGGFAAIRFDDDPSGARSEHARDELALRLLTIIVPLPAEPVGPGASWRAVTILRQGPIYAKQTATYTLTARSPAGWKLHVKLQRVGEQQPLADPALPRGTTAELLAMFRSLEGDVEVDPAYPLITGGTLAIESRMHVRLHGDGQPATEQMFEDTGRVVLSLCPTDRRKTAVPRSAAGGTCTAD